jgi:hypothetical protein
VLRFIPKIFAATLAFKSLQNTPIIFLILYLLNLLNFIAKQHICSAFASQDPELIVRALRSLNRESFGAVQVQTTYAIRYEIHPKFRQNASTYDPLALS